MTELYSISIDNLFNRIKESIIVKNSFYTFLLQLLNYVLPLVLIPYLTRMLGKEGFGKVAFTQSFVSLANVLIEYGFSLSATREISQNRNDKNLLNKIVTLTIFSRFFLLTITFLIITPLFLVIPIFKQDIELFFVSYLLLFSLSLSTDWYFLGIENVKISSFAIIFGKILLLLLTFSVIKKNTDPVYYLIIFGTTTFISNIINILIVKRHVNFFLPNLKEVLLNLKNSISLFIFRITVSLYTSANAFLIGLILSPAQVGIYAGAEKIVKAMSGIWTPLMQVIYPRISNLVKENIQNAKKLLNIVIVLFGIIGISLTIILFLGAEFLSNIILGSAYSESIVIIKILSPVVLLIAMSNILGILWLLPLKRDKNFNYLIMIAGITNIILGLPLTIALGTIGMAISVVLTELLVTLGCLYLINKFKEISFV